MDANSGAATVKDPVCGMDVDPETTAFKLEHDGRWFYFCSRGCMLDFQDEPERFMDPSYQPTGMDGHSH